MWKNQKVRIIKIHENSQFYAFSSELTRHSHAPSFNCIIQNGNLVLSPSFHYFLIFSFFITLCILCWISAQTVAHHFFLPLTTTDNKWRGIWNIISPSLMTIRCFLGVSATALYTETGLILEKAYSDRFFTRVINLNMKSSC